MEQSTLIPFVRKHLDILFVGLNPAKGSSRNRHYFSVNQAFWNQLCDAGLTTLQVDKAIADEVIFGGKDRNFRGWSYGITDLITSTAESDSSKIKPTRRHCKELRDLICRLSPKTVILLHGKVLDIFLPFLGCPVPAANSGQLGRLIKNCPTMFFNIAFPHGNTITSEQKVREYKRVKQYLCELDERLK